MRGPHATHRRQRSSRRDGRGLRPIRRAQPSTRRTLPSLGRTPASSRGARRIVDGADIPGEPARRTTERATLRTRCTARSSDNTRGPSIMTVGPASWTARDTGSSLRRSAREPVTFERRCARVREACGQGAVGNLALTRLRLRSRTLAKRHGDGDLRTTTTPGLDLLTVSTHGDLAR